MRRALFILPLLWLIALPFMLIVAILVIPQSLAHALLAGLPAEVGLYASIAPLVLYTIFGTSRVLAVGPVAVVSLVLAVLLVTHLILVFHPLLFSVISIATSTAKPIRPIINASI